MLLLIIKRFRETGFPKQKKISKLLYYLMCGKKDGIVYVESTTKY